MKRIVSFLLVAALITVLFSGCGIKITIEKDDEAPDIIGSIKDKADGLFGGKDKDKDDGQSTEDDHGNIAGKDDSGKSDGKSSGYTLTYDEAAVFCEDVFSGMTSVFCDSLFLGCDDIEDENAASIYMFYPAMAGFSILCERIAGRDGCPDTAIDNGYTDYEGGYDKMIASGLCTVDDAALLKQNDAGDTFYEYFRIRDLQPYFDYIYGADRVDTSSWVNDKEVSDNYYGYYVTGTGYILYHTGIGDMTYMLSSAVNIDLDGDRAEVIFKRICVFPWDGEVDDGFEVVGSTTADYDSLYEVPVQKAYDMVLAGADFSEKDLTDHKMTLFKDADGIHIYEAEY